MIYLLYGPDTYRSRILLRAIIEEHKRKTENKSLALFRFDMVEVGPQSFLEYFKTAPLFGGKQLIIIERALSAGKNIFSAVEPSLDEWAKSKETIFVFWDEDISGKEYEMERVKKHAAKTQEFSLLNGRKLEQWLDAELEKRKLRLSLAAKRALIDEGGGDLWKLTGKLDVCEAGGVSRAKLAVREEKIWDFTDNFLKDVRRSLVSASRLTYAGEDTLYLFGSLLRTLRVIYAMRDATERKVTIDEVGKKLKLHPFVAKKQAAASLSVGRDVLKKKYRLLLSADENIKTGKLPAPIAFLNLFVRN